MGNGKYINLFRRAMRYLIACIVLLFLWLIFIVSGPGGDSNGPLRLIVSTILILLMTYNLLKKKEQKIRNLADWIYSTISSRISEIKKPFKFLCNYKIKVKEILGNNDKVKCHTEVNDTKIHVNKEKTENVIVLQWASYEDVLEVEDNIIKNPMTYWSNGETYIPEASCIKKNLHVDQLSDQESNAKLMSNSYESMTPGQRGYYLNWLACGKQGQLYDSGYALTYFYGLERRVLIEGKDINLIIPEVLRLLYRYSEFGSLNICLNRFIAYAVAKTGPESLTKECFTLCFAQSLLKDYSDDLLAVILSRYYLHNLPLSPCWAFEVARHDSRTPCNVVIDLAPEGFRSLFLKKYSERFKTGIYLKEAVNERLIEYDPANPSLSALKSFSGIFAPVRINNILGINGQFGPLVKIWSECIDELRAYQGQKEIESLERNSEMQNKKVAFSTILNGADLCIGQNVKEDKILFKTATGETIPTLSRCMSDIVIDDEALKRKMAETEDLSRILNEDLSDTEDESGRSNGVEVANLFDGLDKLASETEKILTAHHPRDIAMNCETQERKKANAAETSTLQSPRSILTEKKSAGFYSADMQTLSMQDTTTASDEVIRISECAPDIVIDNEALKRKMI